MGAAWGLGLRESAASGVAWVFAVIFAYITNRIFVFESRVRHAGGLFREFGAFIFARIFSGAVTVAAMAVFVEHMGFNDILILTACQIFVVIFNYIASKWIIFKK